MIVYRTSMEKMPENCKECIFEHCHLPMKKNNDEIRKEYEKKRHKECPLMEQEDNPTAERRRI